MPLWMALRPWWDLKIPIHKYIDDEGNLLTRARYNRAEYLDSWVFMLVYADYVPDHIVRVRYFLALNDTERDALHSTYKVGGHEASLLLFNTLCPELWQPPEL